MHISHINIPTSNAQRLQYVLLTVFTLFCLTFCISAYRAYHLETADLNAVTGKVKAITYHKAKGKQAKPEVWINFSDSEKYRVSYGSSALLQSLPASITPGEEVTIYLQKPHQAFFDFGMGEDVLQIAKAEQVVYSIDVPQERYHGQFIASSLMCVIFPLLCFFYWEKAKKNNMMAAMHQSRIPQSHMRVA